MLQRHALPRSRIAHDHEGLAVLHLQCEPRQHLLPVECLVQVLKLDHRSKTMAQKASSTSSSTAEYTTACIVLRPTPSAPPRVPSPTAMLAPTRPARASPASTGPSSSIIVLPTRVPTKYSGTVPVKVYEAWRASTTPVNAAMKRATGSESTPTRRICTGVSRPHVA